jgi:hypothetical protein
MGSLRPADRCRRGSRRSPAAPQRRDSGERLFSYKRLLQAGSAAAALGSILALAFTVGDRALGLFGNEASPDVHLTQVALEKMSYGAYLVTEEGKTSLRGEGTRRQLATNILAVNFDATFEGSAKGTPYPIRLTLQTRDTKGRIDESVDSEQDPYLLDADNDTCGCHTFFSLPRRGVAYRVDARILRPNTPNAQPLAVKQSKWYQP